MQFNKFYLPNNFVKLLFFYDPHDLIQQPSPPLGNILTIITFLIVSPYLHCNVLLVQALAAHKKHR